MYLNPGLTLTPSQTTATPCDSKDQMREFLHQKKEKFTTTFAQRKHFGGSFSGLLSPDLHYKLRWMN